MTCTNTVTQYVPSGYTHREIETPCGRTSIHGTRLQCEDCENRANRQHPQGWRNTPGDTCRHGTYLGCHEDSDERQCGACESGE